jgi:hypothetical protein
VNQGFGNLNPLLEISDNGGAFLICRVSHYYSIEVLNERIDCAEDKPGLKTVGACSINTSGEAQPIESHETREPSQLQPILGLLQPSIYPEIQRP